MKIRPQEVNEMIREAIAKLSKKENLTYEEAKGVMELSLIHI